MRMKKLALSGGVKTWFDLYIICRCLLPDKTRHKVNDPMVDYSGDLGRGNFGHEPKLEPSWSVLLIDPLSAMWAGWA